jgi:hypothetical protein
MERISTTDRLVKLWKEFKKRPVQLSYGKSLNHDQPSECIGRISKSTSLIKLWKELQQRPA